MQSFTLTGYLRYNTYLLLQWSLLPLKKFHVVRMRYNGHPTLGIHYLGVYEVEWFLSFQIKCTLL